MLTACRPPAMWTTGPKKRYDDDGGDRGRCSKPQAGGARQWPQKDSGFVAPPRPLRLSGLARVCTPHSMPLPAAGGRSPARARDVTTARPTTCAQGFSNQRVAMCAFQFSPEHRSTPPTGNDATVAMRPAGVIPAQSILERQFPHKFPMPSTAAACLHVSGSPRSTK